MLLVDAESEEELYEIVEGLPIWEQVEITRMQGFEELVSPDETAGNLRWWPASPSVSNFGEPRTGEVSTMSTEHDGAFARNL